MNIKLYKKAIKSFDKRVKSWTQQEALGYLVKLGTHNSNGEITVAYGGTGK